MSTALFVALSGVYSIGVTGTRGKTTVAHLLYHILKNAGKTVFLGGNVRGVSTLSLLEKVKKDDYAVLELDSWQLQGFGERNISPRMAVFTNFMPDHMNYYGGNMDRYWRDKEHIFIHQTEKDYIITTSKIIRYINRFSNRKKIKNKVVISKKFPRGWKSNILGKHNKQNCAIAIAAARTLLISDSSIRKTIKEFPGVPGRLEFLREIKGIKIYNDTTATTPDATIAALTALQETRSKKQKARIILIMGGADKRLDMSKLVKEIPKYCKTVILLPGTGTDKLQIANFKLQITNVKNLKEAVDEAMGEARRGDIVLFSPAFASFGLFKNEFDRGQQFNDIIKNL